MYIPNLPYGIMNQDSQLEFNLNSMYDSYYDSEFQNETTCKHEPINVGFQLAKWVCKKCDQDLKGEY